MSHPRLVVGFTWALLMVLWELNIPLGCTWNHNFHSTACLGLGELMKMKADNMSNYARIG